MHGRLGKIRERQPSYRGYSPHWLQLSVSYFLDLLLRTWIRHTPARTTSLPLPLATLGRYLPASTRSAKLFK